MPKWKTPVMSIPETILWVKQIERSAAVRGQQSNISFFAFTATPKYKTLQLFGEKDEYKILIVPDKYQTGFDQPLLHTMYVDKKLSGVRAVQTLSRLNRICPGKEDTFVLDFANDRQTILDSFQPYYEVTSITEETDVKHLYDLKARLDEFQIY